MRGGEPGFAVLVPQPRWTDQLLHEPLFSLAFFFLRSNSGVFPFSRQTDHSGSLGTGTRPCYHHRPCRTRFSSGSTSITAILNRSWLKIASNGRRRPERTRDSSTHVSVSLPPSPSANRLPFLSHLRLTEDFPLGEIWWLDHIRQQIIQTRKKKTTFCKGKKKLKTKFNPKRKIFQLDDGIKRLFLVIIMG